MKNYVKSALDTLTALDFQLDHKDRELRTDRWRFTHANEPDTTLTLNFKMSEQAARSVERKAKQIVGLATTEAGEKPKARTSNRAKQERATERKRRETAQSLADARRERERTQAATAIVVRRQRELEGLMSGRPDGGSNGDLPPDALMTVEEAADWTGLTDKAVRRAIDSGALEAYQVGKQVKVKGSDVRAWLRGAS